MLDKINNKKIIIIIIIVIIIISLILVFRRGREEEVQIIEEINNEENIIEEHESEGEKIIIHITGCVKNQGIVEIDQGKRIVDVIAAAGGVTEDADITKVNLAYIVKDAQKIYIPSIYDEKELEYISVDNGDNVIIDDNSGGEKTMININKATQTELEQLPGIGPSTALKIIQYREENKKFNSIEEIKEVPGIGDAKFNSIKDMIEI